MNLLRRCPNSVIWLLESSPAAARNLREEARRRGIDPGRLVFARHKPLAEHLARYKLADLYLDTFPYNGHTTASDALWVGVPVVTYSGETFASRVAASLLYAIGLPELITTSPEAYEDLAHAFATNPAALADVKAKLERQRDTYPLFDTRRSCRHIESAYLEMWGRYQRGEPPASFAVKSQD
jgi:predicted O-linked N-acetylglucosamine transferase (SPINDLY family)